MKHNGASERARLTNACRYKAILQNNAHVAYAIVTGMINREKVPGDLLEAIEGQMDFF